MASGHADMGASVIVSKFSDRLNDARGKESIRAVSKRAAQIGGVGESTLHPYFRDGHPRPTMPVVVALALALQIPSQELRELAGIPAEGEPWMPPAESRLMSDRQRRAVTELIRSFVPTQGAENVTPIDSPTQSDASTEAAETEEAERLFTVLRFDPRFQEAISQDSMQARDAEDARVRLLRGLELAGIPVDVSSDALVTVVRHGDGVTLISIIDSAADPEREDHAIAALHKRADLLAIEQGRADQDQDATVLPLVARTVQDQEKPE